MSWEDEFLNETPPPALDAKIFAAVDGELKKVPRRQFWSWALAPAAFAFAAVFAFRLSHKPDDELWLADLGEETELAENEGLELMDDLDVIEDLEDLEQWTT